MFYTHVEKSGNSILYRGYDDSGKRFSKKVDFQPSLFVESKTATEYKSLLGNKNLARKRFENMREAMDFVEKYKDVSGMNICGNTDYVAQFIQENYPDKIEFDGSKINIFKFDIEVDISDGYADTNTADKEVTSIFSHCLCIKTR